MDSSHLLFGVYMQSRTANPNRHVAGCTCGRGQSQTSPPPNNPIQSSVALFQVLQQKSRVFPDLATNGEPFGAWQKFKLAANNSVSLSTVGQALVAAGFSQAINSASGYGQGADGYAKRFGANMARSASDNLFGTFLIASVLHEDPRFYVRKGLSFKETLKYAAPKIGVHAQRLWRQSD